MSIKSQTIPEDRGFASKPDLVRRTMDLVVSPDVRSQDAKIVIANMLGNPDTRDLAWTLERLLSSPTIARADTSQKEQIRKVPSFPESPSSVSSVL